MHIVIISVHFHPTNELTHHIVQNSCEEREMKSIFNNNNNNVN
jgi:hypothetical protein